MVVVVATLVTLVVGAIFGLIAYLIMPGRNSVPIWAAILIGMVAMPLGALLANVFGVSDTPGFDWIELLVQVSLVVAGVAVVAGVRSRQRVR